VYRVLSITGLTESGLVFSGLEQALLATAVGEGSRPRGSRDASADHNLMGP
jgi:hypothetical protein